MTSHIDGREYDIIFAGGGTAACVTAGRLAETNRDLSILIIETGKNSYQNPKITDPAQTFHHILPGAESTLLYVSNKSDAVNGREIEVRTGGVLGGGSSVNFMAYSRASSVDYDSWQTEGWDTRNLMRFAKRIENFCVDDPAIDTSVHGYNGPLEVSFRNNHTLDRQDDFFAAAESLGHKRFADIDDFEACGGFGRVPRWGSSKNVRSDVSHHYLHPHIQSGNHPNLHLLLESKVSRIIFEGTRATGVEYEPASNATAEVRVPAKVVKAKKLVVLSAGALGTPCIMERSGLGGAERLARLGIPVISDLPQVGENLQDQNRIFHGYRARFGVDDAHDAAIAKDVDMEAALEGKDPLLGWNAVDLIGKLRPTDEEAAALGPEFLEAWNRDFKEQKTKPVMLVNVLSGWFSLRIGEDVKKDNYISCPVFTAHPYSRGSIHIASRDMHTRPSFDAGFLTNDLDMKQHLWAYKAQREFARRSNFIVEDAPAGHPKFRQGSKAASALAFQNPSTGARFKTEEERRNLAPLEYDAEDDAAIEEYVRSHVETMWHSIGTAKMAPREKGGVVDKHLSVYGTQGLKIGDLSICPANVSASTSHTAMLIGEHLADIIAVELDLNLCREA